MIQFQSLLLFGGTSLMAYCKANLKNSGSKAYVSKLWIIHPVVLSNNVVCCPSYTKM